MGVICKSERSKWTPNVSVIRDRTFFCPTPILIPLKWVSEALLYQKGKEKKFVCVHDAGFKIFLLLFKMFNLLCPLHINGGEVILKSYFLITFKMGFLTKSGGRGSCQEFFFFNELWFPDEAWIWFKSFSIHMQFNSRIKQVKPKQVFHL